MVMELKFTKYGNKFLWNIVGSWLIHVYDYSNTILPSHAVYIKCSSKFPHFSCPVRSRKRELCRNWWMLLLCPVVPKELNTCYDCSPILLFIVTVGCRGADQLVTPNTGPNFGEGCHLDVVTLKYFQSFHSSLQSPSFLAVYCVFTCRIQIPVFCQF